jgi:hypothetical protein
MLRKSDGLLSSHRIIKLVETSTRIFYSTAAAAAADADADVCADGDRINTRHVIGLFHGLNG